MVRVLQFRYSGKKLWKRIIYKDFYANRERSYDNGTYWYKNRRNIKDSKLSDSEIITISIVGELFNY